MRVFGVVLAVDWEIKALDRDHCIALWDRVLIQVWHFSTTTRAVTALDTVTREFIARCDAPISSIAIVERTSPPPADDVRKLLAKFYREHAPRMKEQIVVADGGGFRSAMVRAVGVTLSALAPNALPFRFVGAVAEATKLVAPHLSSAAGGDAALRRVVDGVRDESRKVASSA